MRTHSLLLSVSLLVLASHATAQKTAYPANDVPNSIVQVPAAAKVVRLRSDQVREITGSYDMSNGWYLRVQPTRHYINATIDNEKPIRLVPISAKKFVSNNGNITMEFNNYGEDLIMSYIPQGSLASIMVGSARMAQR